ESFGYDSNDRLTSWTVSSKTFGITYDPNGNITSKSDQGTYSYNGPHPHAVTAVGASTYGYDAAGNQTARPGYNLTYTAMNKPDEITNTASGGVTRYGYDADGTRTYKISPTTTTYYVGRVYEMQVSASTGLATQRFFVQTAGRTVAEV